MPLPFYPFYWGDYSSKTFDLTQGQHGTYLLFLRHIYAEGLSVPHEQRYSIAKALLPQEQENADFILARYFVRKGAFWVNLRAEEVMNEWEEKHYRRVIAAQKPRKQCYSNAIAMQQQCTSNALATRTITNIEGKPSVLKEGKKKMAGTVPLKENSEAFKAWEAYWLKTKGKKPTRIDIKPANGKIYRGWYFPTEWPPLDNGGYANEFPNGQSAMEKLQRS